MQLSVIIVNFNVRYFLEQCLYAVQKAMAGLQVEVLVVDNASSDGSVDYLKNRFPFVEFIVNEKNTGFSKANNLALRKATGDYVLFLNPDTLIPEDCFRNCLSFFYNHPQAGALGVRMVDGSGKFLPESKRSFPTPYTSLYKMLGLNALFPKSRTFGRYSLGYLDEHKNHEVDVLAGAFMMVRTQLMKQLHGFDEAFFMYGEDIDVSYRIQQAGFKNHYFAGSTIIHFKGESTRKGSLNYVRIFYQAMSVFVSKHYVGNRAKLFSVLIHFGIWMRAAATVITRIIKLTLLPAVEVIMILLAFMFSLQVGGLFGASGDDAAQNLPITFAGYSCSYLVTGALTGMYRFRFSPVKGLMATGVAVIVTLLSSWMNPKFQFFPPLALALIALTSVLLITGMRLLLLQFSLANRNKRASKTSVYIAGTERDFTSVQRLLSRTARPEAQYEHIDTSVDSSINFSVIAPGAKATAYPEIVFCEGSLTFENIIHLLQTLPSGIYARFHANGSKSIVGSESRDKAGESLSADEYYSPSDPHQQRVKRITDIIIALVILVSFPIQVMISGSRIIPHALTVLSGRKTWIGYGSEQDNLPTLRRGVLASNGTPLSRLNNDITINIRNTDTRYARSYDWLFDLKLIVKHYRRLGRS